MRFFDSHTHVQFASFDTDRHKVVSRALEEGVGFINVGTLKETSRKAVELANEYLDKHIYAAVGLHPIHTADSHHDDMEIGDGEGPRSEEKFDMEYYRNLAIDSKVVAIGECGLDYFRINNAAKGEPRQGREELGIKEKQREVFTQHITLAKEIKKPLMCHCRPSQNSQDAYEDLYELIKPEISGLTGVILHFFAGNMETAQRFLKLGCLFTFGGVITFIRDYDEVIRRLPLEYILTETDAPYVSPHPYRGKRNEPAYVIEVVEKLSELKQISLEKFSKQILTNNERAFGITLSSRYNTNI